MSVLEMLVDLVFHFSSLLSVFSLFFFNNRLECIVVFNTDVIDINNKQPPGRQDEMSAVNISRNHWYVHIRTCFIDGIGTNLHITRVWPDCHVGLCCITVT